VAYFFGLPCKKNFIVYKKSYGDTAVTSHN